MTLGGGGGDIAANNSYEAWILDMHNGISPTFDGIHGLAEAHVRPWDEIIRIPSIEEQVRMLCSAGIPASAIVYALGDTYSEMIPAHIFDQAHGQQNATVPFAAEAAANPMAAPAHRSPDMPPPVLIAPAAAAGIDPAMPPVQGAIPMQPPPVQAAPPAAAPADTGFDAQPVHADNARSQNTMEAIQRARQRQAAGRTAAPPQG